MFTMNYKIQITELLKHNVDVDADTVEEAKQKVMTAYYNNIELTVDNYVDGSVQFEVLD